MKRRMVLLMPYYGQLPPCFNYWLRSLAGMDFDVICFTDLPIGEHPGNFRVQPMSLEDLRTLAERKIGVPVNLTYGYKLCDLKPMYGQIFEDYIGDYDYWAYGDCDLVYGRALNGILGRLLADSVYDVISFRRWWVSGPFCVIRNSFAAKTLYLKTGNYAQVLDSPRYECYDELGGWWHSHVKSGKMSVEECGRLKDNFSAALWRQEGLSFFHEDLMSEDALRGGETVEMRSGRLSRNGVEIPLFHYVESKHSGGFKAGLKPCAYGRIDNYRITRTGFYRASETWARRRTESVFRTVLGWCYDGAFCLGNPRIAWRRWREKASAR